MSVLWFLLFSMLEWTALIILSFTMFKIEIRGYRGQIIFTSFLLSLLSYILIVALDLVTFATFLQPPVVFMFYWQMFRIPAFYAGLIMTNGYLAYIVTTTLVYGVFQIYNIDLIPGTAWNFLAQTLTSILALSAALLIYKFRLGYTFVPYGEHTTIKLTRINLQLLVFTIVGYLVMTCFNYFLYVLGIYKQNYMIIPVILAFGALQYWVFRKEYLEHD